MTAPGAPSPPPPAPASTIGEAATTDTLYKIPADATKALATDYLYWTGKLTDTSVELSYGVLAANWAAFGSVNQILTNGWSQASVVLVLINLAFSLIGAKWMGERHRERIEYAESDIPRWEREFAASKGKRDPWPFTGAIESAGRDLRELKTWLPVLGGITFVIGLVTR